MLAADEVLLEADLALAGHGDPGLDRVVGHRQQAQPEPPGGGDLGRDLGEGGPLGEPLRAVQVGGQVAVAQAEPGRWPP